MAAVFNYARLARVTEVADAYTSTGCEACGRRLSLTGWLVQTRESRNHPWDTQVGYCARHKRLGVDDTRRRACEGAARIHPTHDDGGRNA